MVDDSGVLVSQLRATLGKMEAALSAIVESIVWTDAHGKIQWSNATFDHLVHRQRFQVLGASLFDILPLEQEGQELSCQQHPLSLILKGQLNATGLFGFRQAESHLLLEISSAQIQLKGEICVVLVIRDITERQQVGEALRQSEQKLSLHVQQTPLAVIEWNLNLEVSDWNPAAERIFGYCKSEALARTAVELIVPASAATDINKVWNNLLAQKGGMRSTHENRTKDGRTIICEWYNTSLVDHNGQVIGLASLVQDITQRKQAEESLIQSEAKFRSLIQNSSDIITILEPNGTVRYESPSIEKVLGYKPADLIGKNVFAFIHPEDTPHVFNAFREILQSSGTPLSIEFRFRHQDGSWHFLESTGNNLLADPSLAGIVVNSRDITERKLAEQQLRHNAFHDGLTGLPNRALFMDRLAQALNRTQHCDGYQFAVLFLDLDRFKLVNDSLGHLLGDQLLIAIAHRLERCLRSVDTMARIGGDEFVILLDNITDSSDATKTAERLQRSLRSPFNLSGHEVFTTVSIGIALSTIAWEQPGNFLRDADTAMYKAKALGRGSYELFDQQMHAHAVTLLELENDLRWAIERQEFEIHYQPVVSLETSKITGFEALVRWQHPTRGLVFPAEFIPVAEESGLIIPLGQWVLAQACRQIRDWQVHFPTSPPLAVSVNISGKQFSQPDLIEQVGQILQEINLDAQSLRLEITESVLMENAESAAAMLFQLKAMNIQLHMDDFGTGYSSLTYLHRFPMDVLKIDRTFISTMDIDGRNAEIVQTIITLAHNLGMAVTAEGIETAGQLAKLRALGCEYGQGYFFSKPVVPELAEALIAQGSWQSLVPIAAQ